MSAADQSLNAGNELDNEDIFENIEPGKTPDLAEDIVLFTSLEARFDDLIDLRKDIEITGGMRRQFALEAEQILPGILNAPLNHYSESPSRTLFQISMEELSKGMWALIAAAGLAVVALIAKVIGWLTGSKETKKEGDVKAAVANTEAKVTQVEQSQEAAIEIVEALKDANAEMRHNPIVFKTREGQEIKYSNMDNVIAELFTDDSRYGDARKFLDDPKPIHMDIVNFGPYSQLFDQCSKAHLFRLVRDILNVKIRELQEIRNTDIRAEGNLVVDLYRRLDTVTKPISLRFEGKERSLSDIADVFSEARQKAAEAPVKRNIHFDDLFNSIEKAVKKPYLLEGLQSIADSVPVLEDMRKALTEVTETVSDLSADGAPGGNTEGVAVRLRNAIPVLGHEISGLARIMQEFERYAHDFNYLVREVDGFSKEIVRKVSREMDMSGAQTPPAWKKIMDRVNISRAVLKKAYFGR